MASTITTPPILATLVNQIAEGTWYGYNLVATTP